MPPDVHAFHPASDPQALARIQQRLYANLPVSLPVYRRIQVAQFTPTSRIVTSISALDPSGDPDAVLDQTSPTSQDADEPHWFVAYSDPDRGPETQIFFHGSWERTMTEPRPSAADSTAATALLRAFVVHLKHKGGYPAAAATDEPPGTDMNTSDRPVPSPTILLGAIHSTTAALLSALGVLPPSDLHPATRLPPQSWHKWIFDLAQPAAQARLGRAAEDADGDAVAALGLRWGALGTAAHYALVRGRTAIRRRDRTLRMLPSVGLFPADDEDGMPVAWTFLGLDGSLQSLHVEEGWRGKGLAKRMAFRAWRGDLRGHEGDRWGHADVAPENVASNGVCGSLGGEVRWVDYWLNLDLDRV